MKKKGCGIEGQVILCCKLGKVFIKGVGINLNHFKFIFFWMWFCGSHLLNVIILTCHLIAITTNWDTYRAVVRSVAMAQQNGWKPKGQKIILH